MDPVLQWLLGIISTLVVTLFSGVVVPLLVKYLNAKTNNENVQSIVTELGDTVSSTVGFINQTLVNQLKADGKWDSEAQSRVLSAAVQEAVAGLSAKTMSLLGKDGLDVEHIIMRRIEAEIEKRKKLPQQAS